MVMKTIQIEGTIQPNSSNGGRVMASLAKAADGKATKIIIPSEIQGLAGLVAGMKAVSENEKSV